MMNWRSKRIGLLIQAIVLPVYCFGENGIMNFHQAASLISFGNLVLFITSLICTWQYFFPSAKTHIAFHVFNMAFIIAFYWISLRFLLTHKFHYDMDGLSAAECLKRFFFTFDIHFFKNLLIAAAFVINILYIIRGDDYHGYTA